ncbi:MAG: RelA/SpoT domain-containing protein [bacterium]
MKHNKQPVDEKCFQEFINTNFPSSEKWEEDIKEQIQLNKSILGAVKPAIEDIINTLNKKYREKENREFARVIQGKEDIKSPRRIVEKIIQHPNKYNQDNFAEEMEDIARMRIVCNYLSDISEIANSIRDNEVIKGICRIVEETDYVFMERDRPHRAYHFILESTLNQTKRKVELQIMTMLQEAWDKKDHNLIYEKIRIGKEIDKKDRIKMGAMSELLYIADEFFDYLRKKILHEEE